MNRWVRWGRVVAVAIAVTGGCVASATAVRLSDYPGPPAESLAVAAAATAIGRQPTDIPGPRIVCDYWCPETAGEDVVAYDSPPDRTDVVAVTFDLRQGYAADVSAAARDRLLAAGWHASSDDGFVRDGLRVDLQIADSAGGVPATVLVSKSFSATAAVLAITGFVLGAVLGWLVAAVAVRRYYRHGAGVRAVVAAMTGVFVIVPLTYAARLVVLGYRLSMDGAWKPRDVQLAEFALTLFPVVSIAVAGVGIAALALLALPPQRHPATPAPAAVPSPL